MARGAASPASGSSSSGFSSDEDMEDVSLLSSTASRVPVVSVDVLDEADADVEAPENPASPSSAVTSAPSGGVSSVLSCCLDAVNPAVSSESPLSFDYELYTAAIAHLTWHWPSPSDEEPAEVTDKRLLQYHALRANVFTRFQQAFPLTEAMYVQWIADTSACMEGSQPLEAVKKLYELASSDYWSVPLTLQCLRLLRDAEDAETLEKAMDQAQKTVGLHFTQGHEVWALCRELTTERFDDLEDDSTPETAANRALLKEQAVRELFRKQMQLPLDQNDLVMSEFRAWDAYNTLDKAVKGSALEEASERQSKLFTPLMKKLRAFETRLNAAQGTQEAANPEQAWLEYLNFVKHRVAPLLSASKTEAGTSKESRQLVVCLYERAVAAMCLSPTLWASYLAYLEAEEGDGKLRIAQRAVRNVSFDSSVWTQLLIEMERRQQKPDEISQFVRLKLLTRSTPPVMDQYHFLSVLLTWCDVIRRHTAARERFAECLEDRVEEVEALLGTVFSECKQFMATTFPAFVEAEIRLTEYQAKCYWAQMPPVTRRSSPGFPGKLAKWKAVWDLLLASSSGDQAATWLTFLEASQRIQAFSVAELRVNVFEAALKQVKDVPLAIAEASLVFERENGDLSSYLLARGRHAKLSTVASAPSAPSTTPVDAGETTKTVAKKRKSSSGQASKESQPVKRVKIEASRGQPKNEEAAAAMTTQVSKTKKDPVKKLVHESLTNEHTLFLCDVAKEATKEDVEALFKSVAGLKDVRLVVKTRGARVKSRGMAYVQFSDEAGVEEGLQLNGCLLHGHPLRVERSKPPVSSASAATSSKPSASSGRDGSWKTNPVTLYVGGLNREKAKQQITEQQLQEALQQAVQAAGEFVVVTRASILKDRHGKLKNYGLVEVSESEQIAKCLANMAGLQGILGEQVTLKPSRFSITEILEQQEKQQKQKQGAATSGRGGAGKEAGGNAPHSKPSTRLALSGSATSLMPRALRRKLAAQSNEAKAAHVTPKTNEDFRKLLFKK
ncbi:hypothetical protein BBJ28_00007256 [Nothophytophthora sp. Chile5]|nr:hypothetical protein BBJ28_00007256 [Nothophytophthora sp. Chile5]